MAQMVKNPPAVQETWVPSLGQEDPLEKGKATHSSILAWRIPQTEEPGGLKRESLPHPEERRFRLLAREEGSFPAWSAKNSRRS